MSKTIGQFSYTITKFQQGDPMPFDPWVVIDLARYGRTSKAGSPIISANLMSADEIDYHIKALQHDLEAVRKEAKLALAKAIEKARQYRAS